MSAFLVTENTVHRAMSLFTGREMPTTESLSDFGRRVIHLNYRALGERYGDDVPDLDELAYTWDARVRKPLDALKALDCIIYQCSEGDVVNDPLYERLRTRADEVRRVELAKVPEYAGAKWDR